MIIVLLCLSVSVSVQLVAAQVSKLSGQFHLYTPGTLLLFSFSFFIIIFLLLFCFLYLLLWSEQEVGCNE